MIWTKWDVIFRFTYNNVFTSYILWYIQIFLYTHLFIANPVNRDACHWDAIVCYTYTHVCVTDVTDIQVTSI
jgi:hypothetical protein